MPRTTFPTCRARFTIPGLVMALMALAATSCDTTTGPDAIEGPFEVAFVGTMHGEHGLHLVQTDGTGLTRVTGDSMAARWYAVSPTGERIAVVLASAENGMDLYVVNRDGSGVRNLTNNPEWGDGLPAWSPDGSRIAYDTPAPDGRSDVWVANADGSSPTNLTPPLGGHQEGGAVWSPDGTKLAFVSLRSGNPDIWVMNADGSEPVNLTDSPASEEKWPAWSPDGSRIAFSRHSGGPGIGDIYVIDTDGTNLANLTQNPTRNDDGPLWSSDGARILFTAEDPDAEPDVMVMNADGTGLVNVSDHESLDYHASWSPDGSRIAFTSFRDGLRQVYLVGPDGTGLRRLIEPEGMATENWLESRAAWGPAPR